MEGLALIVAIIALIIAILAYQKAGGVVDLKKQTEVLAKMGDSIIHATDSMRNKTADIIDRMEGIVRGAEERKEVPKTEKTKDSKKD